MPPSPDESASDAPAGGTGSESVVILMADDDEDDRLLTQDALKKAKLLNPLRFVADGEELLEYLQRRGRYAPPAEAPFPGVILLDLNMPRMDGREVLAKIKADAALRSIPITVLTTSKAAEDVFRTYDLGVNSFITKPVDFESLVAVMRDFGRYWFQIVELPRKSSREGTAT